MYIKCIAKKTFAIAFTLKEDYMEDKIQKAVLIGLNTRIFTDAENSTDETLDELEELLQTAGGECVAKVLQNLPTPNARIFIGEGKLAEVKELAIANDAEMLIFDNELSPAQIKNIEDETGLAIMDRSGIILDIFAGRALSLEGKLQVELAQYKYILPRLYGLGKSMSRLGGGIGTRGPGETKLETDRRHIKSRITKLQRDLEEVKLNRETMRKGRVKSKNPSVALVGYTNAGKSTLLNTLTGAGIHANDRLFDTLDPTTKKLKVSDTLDVFLSDTVGFIRKLPHHLVNAFKATLEEVLLADLLLHVVDVSNPSHNDYIKTVNEVLEKIGAKDIPTVLVFNKSDLTGDTFITDDAICISAKTNAGIKELLDVIEGKLRKNEHYINILIPYCDGYVIDELFRSSKVEISDYNDVGTILSVTCDDIVYSQIEKYLIKE